MLKFLKLLSLIFLLSGFGSWLYFQYFAAERPRARSNYARAVHILRTKIWNQNRETIYCGAAYNEKGEIILPDGFKTPSHSSRSSKIEWEHAVPVENFGRAFKEWREGDPVCVSKGKAYKGRKCASKASAEFRDMEADMYNLFPSIGSVNAVRGNRRYSELPDIEPSFGSCAAKAQGKLFEPPDRAKGQVARAALYMDKRYSKFRLSAPQKKLFSAWSKRFPPNKNECERARQIRKIQKTENIFISEACAKEGL